MNLVSRRTAARAGVIATALVAAGAFAAPAHASDNVDLAVSVTGTTIAAGATEKEAEVTISNKTAGSAATGVTLTFDLSGLQQSVVAFEVPAGCAAPDAEKKSTCVIGELAGGANVDVGFKLKKVGAGTPGKIVVSVKHDGTDPDASNDKAEATVTLGGNGADLYAFAPDVYQMDAQGDFTDQPIVVGNESELWILVVNQGDVTGRGVRFAITLPDHVSFTAAEDDCTHAVGAKTTECEYSDIALVPVKQDTKDDDNIYSGLWFYFPVKVAADAPAPGALTGGEVTVEAMAQDPIITITTVTPATSKLPKNAQAEAPSKLTDADPTDNTDEFSVFVTKAAGNSGSLPITGVQVGVIGGVGIAVIAIGGTLLMLSRRRRVVTVTPDDESTTK